MSYTVSKSRLLLTEVIIAGIALLLFLPGLGSVHLFDWDEINFAESAREMLASGDWLNVQINFFPFWEKPPLFIWMQALSMHLFGVNEFAARFPNAICGMLTLVLLFRIGYRYKGYNFGLLWAMLYASSFFPFFYFKSGIIDPWFNLFIFLGIYFFVRYTEPSQNKLHASHVILSALFIGLAILTKGPVGLLIFLITFAFYLIFNRFHLKFKWLHVLLFFVVLTLVGGLWFILQLLNGNYSIIVDFIVYQIRLFKTQDAGHGGFLLYHFVMILIGVFPAVWLALPAFKPSTWNLEHDKQSKHLLHWMMILFWVVLILFTIVRTKIVHYSSMTYFPLTFIAAWYTYQVFRGAATWHTWQKVCIGLTAVIYSIAIVGITFFDQFKVLLLPYVDEFTAGNFQATANWSGYECLIGLIFLICVILFFVWNRHFPERALLSLLLGSLLFISSTMYFVIPQVERYSQAALIEFMEERQGESCYIYTIHKSYAPYFYARRQVENNNHDKIWLFSGAIDKPAYFVLRNTQKEIHNFQTDVPDAEYLYEKNGFAFYRRMPIGIQTHEAIQE